MPGPGCHRRGGGVTGPHGGRRVHRRRAAGRHQQRHDRRDQHRRHHRHEHRQVEAPGLEQEAAEDSSARAEPSTPTSSPPSNRRKGPARDVEDDLRAGAEGDAGCPARASARSPRRRGLRTARSRRAGSRSWRTRPGATPGTGDRRPPGCRRIAGIPWSDSMARSPSTAETACRISGMAAAPGECGPRWPGADQRRRSAARAGRRPRAEARRWARGVRPSPRPPR